MSSQVSFPKYMQTRSAFHQRHMVERNSKHTNTEEGKAGSALHSGQELVRFRFNSGRSPPRDMLRHAPIVYADNYTGNLVGVSGEQSVLPLAEFPNLYQMIGTSGTMNPGPLGIPITPFELIPHFSISNTASMQSTMQASFERCYVKNIQLGITLWNSTNVGCEVDVYFFEARKNIVPSCHCHWYYWSTGNFCSGVG